MMIASTPESACDGLSGHIGQTRAHHHQAFKYISIPEDQAGDRENAPPYVLPAS